MDQTEVTDSRRTGKSVPSDVQRALDAELVRILEIKIRGWQVFSGFIALATTLIFLFTRRPTSFIVVAGALVVFAWFSIEPILARRGFRLTTPIHIFFEQTMPWALMLFLVFQNGPLVAIQSWGPPIIFSGVIILSIVHLRFFIPFITGLLGAAQFLALYFLIIRDGISPVDAQIFNNSVGGAIIRAVILVLAGVLGGFVARGLHRAFGGAARTARARDLFGKYRLEKELAKGGMGVVHRATYCPEGGFRRPVAIKMIHPHLAREQKFVDAFRNEAELCARLLHHNIVQVLDFGRVEDTYFIAMELVEGTTCRALLRRAIDSRVRIPGPIVGAIGSSILAGLHHAHREAQDDDGKPLRVIHRDLGPENILISHAGVVKVTDFGIARALRDSGSAQTKTVVGHSDHMSPEQVSAEELDERCDLFCVGILLWELLCARGLFTRPTDAASLLATLQAPIPKPGTLDPRWEPWDHFLMRALSRAKDGRPSSALEMSAELDKVMDVVGRAGPEDIARFIATLPPEGKDIHDAATLPIGAVVGHPDDAATMVE